MSGGGGILGTAAGLGASFLAPELAPEIFGADAGFGEQALLGSVLGGAGSALAGGNPLLGAAMGGLGGGGGISKLLSMYGTPQMTNALSSLLGPSTTQTPAGDTSQLLPNFDPNTGNYIDTGTTQQNPAYFTPDGTPSNGTTSTGGGLGSMLSGVTGKDLLKYGAYGLGGLTLYDILSGKGNHFLPQFTPQGSTFRSLSPSFAPVRPMAEGGITSLPTAQRLIRPNVNFMGNDSGYPMGQQTAPAYAMSSQMPTSAQQVLASYEPATNPLTGEPTVKSMAIGGPTNYDPYAQLEEQDMVSRLSGMPQITPTASKKGGKIKEYDGGGNVKDTDGVMTLLRRTVHFDPREAPPENPYGPGARYVPGKGQDVEALALPGYGLSELGRALGLNTTVDPRQGFWLPPEHTDNHAAGGQLGSYSDGGQMLKGPGDGMSDSIPASISDKQPARLADGEFVVPADVVSHLGNGSTDAGAKQLYNMMDRIRQARTGTKKQGKQVNPNKFMPA